MSRRFPAGCFRLSKDAEKGEILSPKIRKMNRPVNPLIAELNKDIEQVLVDQETNTAFRVPNFRSYTAIQSSTGKITKKYLSIELALSLLV